jgi:hypothetical protein
MRKALEQGLVELPEDVLFSFPTFECYRMITRNGGTFSPLKREDFLSQIEKKDVTADENIIGYYGCSFFCDIADCQRILKLPRKNKKIIKGRINHKDGAIERNLNSSHVNVFFYDTATPEKDFRII